MDGEACNRYLKSCEKRGLEPIPCVREAFRTRSNSLDLSGNCISVEHCKVLGRTLCHGHPFTKLDFSDCLIGDEGLVRLLEFLKDDEQVTSIVLKGNSIKTKGTLAIADILKRNSTLERLSLEWNSIGVQESDVKILSEALSINGSLRVLDLRSNHIDHTGATHLANMLLQNNTLEDLDLRWNNLGVLGGRKILSGLRNNTSIITLRIEGNNIPSDIAETLNTTLSLRLSHHVMEAQCHAETRHLSAQLDQLHTDAKQKMLTVLDTLDSERAAFLQTTQLSQCEIADLKAHLEERDTTVARLETKLLDIQETLRGSLSRCVQLEKTVDEERRHSAAKEQELNHKIEQLNEEILSLKEKVTTGSLDASAREKEAQTKVHSLELDIKLLQGKLTAAYHERDTLKDDFESRQAALEAQLSAQDSKHTEKISTLQASHKKEFSLHMEDYKNKELMLLQRLQESDERALKLEEDLRAVRSKYREEKGKTAVEVSRVEQDVKLQAMRNRHMEDQIRELKDTHQSTVEGFHSKISQCQAECRRLEDECTKLKHRSKTASEELEQERSEAVKARKSLKDSLREVTEEKETLHKEVSHIKKLLEAAKQEKNDLEKRLESELKELEAERAQLRQKTEQQKMVIQRFQQEEQHRRTQLKDALNTYFNAPPTLTDVI